MEDVMLRFVNKEEYWRVENSGILIQIPKIQLWHLKSIQDAMAFEYLHQCKGKKIAEIGGGNSRISPVMAKHNECYNVDKFEGVGNGPKKEVLFDNVTNINVMMGEFSKLLQDNYFDIIFSISVVEHVPNDMLNSFFKDCQRILKLGGEMIHLIDVYVEDDPNQNVELVQRVMKYREAFTSGLFKSPNPDDVIISEEGVKFSTAFATNPDNVMDRWNKSSPGLKKKREKAQSCTLLMVGIKE